MRRGLQGYRQPQRSPGESFSSFVPRPLPPEPPLELSGLERELEEANRALGRLDGIGMILPDVELMIYFYVRKEAVLSSQIEGTQSSLSDLLLFEETGIAQVPRDDVREVSNYVAALDHGLNRIKGALPLSLRLIRELHEILLRTGRGSEREIGTFRRSQNWVGGTRPGNAAFVPPPPTEVMPLLDSFEKFLHDSSTPPLLKAALAHVQFETIHPFLDGNGRVGRLLIPLLLFSEGALSFPLLYLSLFFKQHRDVYYQHLQAVRLEGDWEAWISFFLEGVRTTATAAVGAARSILSIFKEDRDRIGSLGRAAGSALRVHEEFQRHPLLAPSELVSSLSLSLPTILRSLAALEKLGIIGETTGRRRDRLYAYTRYLTILAEGTEPISPSDHG